MMGCVEIRHTVVSQSKSDMVESNLKHTQMEKGNLPRMSLDTATYMLGL